MSIVLTLMNIVVVMENKYKEKKFGNHKKKKIFKNNENLTFLWVFHTHAQCVIVNNEKKTNFFF